MKFHKLDWEHTYSFGRIISKSIESHETYLINSEIFSTNDWLPAILISLCLNEEHSIFVLSSERIKFLKKTQIDKLKILGFKFFLDRDQLIFSNHRISLVTINNLLNDFKYINLRNQRIIFSGTENIRQDLKNYFRISLYKKDWFYGVNEYDKSNKTIIKTYNFLKKKFFSRKVQGNSFLILDESELMFFSEFFNEHASFSNLFFRVNQALSDGWACWVELDSTNLEWNFFLEPLDELSHIRELLNNNKFVYLSALRKDNFFQTYLKKHSLDIDLVINFKSNFNEKNILLYAPPKQALPNNPLFTNLILDKCKKLSIFRKGLTLILLDDIQLKNKIATKLASLHGKIVLLEKLPNINREIVCSSYDWWINNSHLIPPPDQIIIPLLPIPNMSEPINLIAVSYHKKLTKDWFREFLLPEAIAKLERSIAPLRKNSGKLIILDGRANKRKWGRLLLQSIQPSKKIKYMLPFD